MKLLFWKRTPRAVVSQRPVCVECGYEDIEAHALVSWNEAIQDWQICEVRDHGSCSGCGNTEARLGWKNY